MYAVKIVPGVRFKIDQESYTILRLLSSGKIQVERQGYLTVEIFTKTELIKLLDEGRLEFEVKGKNVRSSEPGSFSTSYSENYLESVQRKTETIFRFEVIKPLLKIRRTKVEVRKRVEEINELSKNPKNAEAVLGLVFIKKVSVSSIYRWIAAYLESGGDIRSLIPSYQNSGGPGKLRSNSDVEVFARQSIQDYYLNQQRVTIKDTFYDVIARIADYNEFAVDPIKGPSYSSMARMISTIPEFELVSKRWSERNAEVKFRAVGHGVKSTYPLERVEMDATRLDLIVVFADGTYIERPYFVAALDKCTKNILGFSVGFGGTGWPAVAQCLRHVLSDKSYVKEKYPFINNEWNAFGVAGTLVLDNGLEFKNNPMKDACYQLGMNLVFAPPRTPEYKGSIERFFGTNATSFSHNQPGTTRSNTQQLAEGENPKKLACIPFVVLIGLLHKWIIDVYSQDLNRGAGGIPAKVWEKATEEYPVDWPNSSRELAILLGRIVTRTITNKGIELKEMTYNSSGLNDILKSFSKDNKGAQQKFTVKYDPANLGVVYVYDHVVISDWIKVPSTCPEYSEGLSEWEHDESRKLARKELGTVDIVALARAKDFLRQQGALWTSKNSQGKAAKLNSDHVIFGESTKIYNQKEVSVDYRLPEIPDNKENHYPNI